MSVQAGFLQEKEFTNYDLLVSIYDSGIAKMFNLKASTLSVLNGLARYYNNKTNIIFPSIETLSKKTNIGLRTISNSINELVSKGLILKSKKSSHNVYSFTNKFWETIRKLDAKSNNNICKNSMRSPANFAGKHNKHEQNKKHYHQKQTQALNSQQNDEILKTHTNIDFKPYLDNEKQAYKQLVNKLESWNFTGSYFIIKSHGIKKINDLVKLVDKKKPTNKGAYLRSLLNIPNFKTDILKNNFKIDINQQEGMKYKSAIPTIKQIKKDKETACTPLDFNKDQAIEYYNKLPEFAKNGFYARELKKKWYL